jgi:hypothetical protein
VKAISNWTAVLEREGGTVEPRDPALATAMVDSIGTKIQ